MIGGVETFSLLTLWKPYVAQDLKNLPISGVSSCPGGFGWSVFVG